MFSQEKNDATEGKQKRRPLRHFPPVCGAAEEGSRARVIAQRAMCGILALLYAGSTGLKLPVSCHGGGTGVDTSGDVLAKKLGARQAHRGPDAQAVLSGSGWSLAHQRLSIMDPVESSNQPLTFDDDAKLAGIHLVHNGEIYNHAELYKTLHAEGHSVTRHTKTDSEVILHCYAAWGWERCVQSLSGMFAIVIIDERDKSAAPQVLAARDHVGIKPLYMAADTASGLTLFSSELKAIHDMVDCSLPSVHIALVPAGCAWVRHAGSLDNAQSLEAGGGVTWQKFFNPAWDCPGYSETLTTRPTRDQVRQALKTAVHRRMMSHVPYGALLSGGVDSCIVTCLMVELAKEHGLDYNWPDGKLRTYTVGMEGSPDIMAAREMARHLGTVHHERLFTAAEACEIVPKVVYHMETYEPELLRSGNARLRVVRRRPLPRKAQRRSRMVHGVCLTTSAPHSNPELLSCRDSVERSQDGVDGGGCGRVVRGISLLPRLPRPSSSAGAIPSLCGAWGEEGGVRGERAGVCGGGGFEHMHTLSTSSL